jgi:hypothetical protein
MQYNNILVLALGGGRNVIDPKLFQDLESIFTGFFMAY